MAKITVEFDTNSKEMEVAIDGTAVENVTYVSIRPSWNDDDEYCCEVSTRVKDEEHDFSTMTTLCASESIGSKVEGAVASTRFEGFVERSAPEHTQLSKDVAAFFGKKIK
jgi:hypothetical protein